MKIEQKENYDYQENIFPELAKFIESNHSKLKTITIEKIVSDNKKHVLLTLESFEREPELFRQCGPEVRHQQQAICKNIKTIYDQIIKIILNFKDKDEENYKIKIEISKNGDHFYDDKEHKYFYVNFKENRLKISNYDPNQPRIFGQIGILPQQSCPYCHSVLNKCYL